MTNKIWRKLSSNRLRTWVVTTVILVGVAYLGSRASTRWLGLLAVGMGGVVLLQRPILGLLALVPAALVIPLEFSTGTAVNVNPVTLLVPVLLAVWLLDIVRRRELRLATSCTTRPLLLFLLAALFSFLAGYALWDPVVPRSGNFTLVQLAQWAIFAFSVGAFWLTGNLVRHEVWLRRLTILYLALAGSLAIFLVLPQIGLLPSQIAILVNDMTTQALHRAPFWLLLAALAGGQLLFNEDLATGWRLFLLVTLGAVLVYVLHLQRVTQSHWVGVAAVAGVLAWLRWPRLRWPVVALLLVLIGTGTLSSTVYEFAGGDVEWERSGGSRVELIRRVLQVSMRNPITGLGPAAYRLYAGMKPLLYGRALWIHPSISSHNNYVDLFAHTGLLGLGLFAWFAVEVTRLGLRLRARFTTGFAAGYVNAMLAAGAGALTVMLLADWILPFVYNIGFAGFQASVLVWLFMGGLVALEQMANCESTS